MPKKDYEPIPLVAALEAVNIDAGRRIEQERKNLAAPPLYGWSQEKHEAYHQRQLDQAQTAAKYCFLRLMEINPD